MNKYLLFLLLPLVFIACRENPERKNANTAAAEENFEMIEQMQWLLGTWVNQNGEEYSQETWSAENDSTFTAYSFVEVNKKKVVFAETMALEQKGENLLLTVAVANQNDKKPVTFKMISLENGQVIFENKNNDFPQRIVYTNSAKDSLHAWIEGTENGEPKKIDFSFSRQ
ncbi:MULTISPECIES: DUF6265 family protein [Aequorivita]|uniref:DUF6265 domain-containing protein n=1 Tax=Aequorivita iocasae TaxID=2803865 RepID=A0ABX7DQE5_9FLAO|nr:MULTISPECIES: DUF6265 family protein [Aequorivita]QQX75662.1 hypothetical protein JK629_09935 [Aequorivita iocasae]UCA55118.1 DUF6265 family protein [Aequorivita sp. F7]